MDSEKQTCDTGTPFASRTVLEHMLRGVLGAVALACGLYLSSTYAWALIPFGVIALIAFRGCPMCWTIGLVETFARGGRNKAD